MRHKGTYDKPAIQRFAQNIAGLMETARIRSYRQLSKMLIEAGYSRHQSTIWHAVTGRVPRIDPELVAVLCLVLKCVPSDLLGEDGPKAGAGEEVVDVRIKMARPNLDFPKYQTPGSAAFDLHADLGGDDQPPVVIEPGKRRLISAGFCAALPPGYVGMVCPRSGLALKHGITVLNAPGLCDADYRDGYGVILANLGDEPFTVKHHDRIAQLMIVKHAQANFIAVDELDETERKGGFGSTGVGQNAEGKS